MEENVFWIKVWLIIAMCFFVLVGSITIYNISVATEIMNLIEKGVDPISAKCAISPGNYDGALCATALMKK